MAPTFCRKDAASDLWFCVTSVSTVTFQNALIFRVHPDHNDDGRIGSTCCHDSHSGGMLGCPQCVKVQPFSILEKCAFSHLGKT